MLDLKQRAFDSVINTLKSLKCSYKITYDGNLYLSEKNIEDKKNKRRVIHKNGELKKHYWPHIGDLKVGELKEVDCGPYKPSDIQSSLTGNASKVWGNNTYSTQVNKEKNTITVFRHTEK